MQLRHATSAIGATISSALSTQPSSDQVLVVDDSRDIRELIALLLRLGGYEVFTAENGADAKAILEVRSPALVISDLEMPICDGWELLSHCHLNHPAMPVLIMSGRTPGLRPDIEHWAAGFLAKPFALEKLQDKVERLIKCAA